MNETYAGILCAVMMLSLYAALHGCLCAFCYKIPCARVICPLLLSAGFVPLSILISRLGVASALNGRLWTTLASLLFILNGAMLILLLRWIGRHVSRISIKESCDRLPAALCFASENGRPRLMKLCLFILFLPCFQCCSGLHPENRKGVHPLPLYSFYFPAAEAFGIACSAAHSGE